MHNFNFTPDMFGLTGHGMRLRTIRGYDFASVASFRCRSCEGGAPSPLRSFTQGGKTMSGATNKRWRRADRSQPAAAQSSNRPTKEGAHE